MLLVAALHCCTGHARALQPDASRVWCVPAGRREESNGAGAAWKGPVNTCGSLVLVLVLRRRGQNGTMSE